MWGSYLVQARTPEHSSTSQNWRTQVAGGWHLEWVTHRKARAGVLEVICLCGATEAAQNCLGVTTALQEVVQLMGMGREGETKDTACDLHQFSIRHNTFPKVPQTETLEPWERLTLVSDRSH